MNNQNTIAREFSLKGIGLHTGKIATVVFKPAVEDTGIIFVRVDLQNKPQVKACVENALSQSSSPRCTCISKDGAQVFTIEHLMAALRAMEIDNLIVEIDHEELPGMDGSSLLFIEALEKAGVAKQSKPRNVFVVKEPMMIHAGAASLAVFPSNEFKISYTLQYNDDFIKSDFFEAVITPEYIKKEIAPSRTFCLEEEAGLLQKNGLGLGANYDNTLVVGKTGVIKNKLRFSNEFVRHKILDLIGDAYLLTGVLKAHIVAVKSGHALNVNMMKKIMDQSANSSRQDLVINSGDLLDVEKIMAILPHREPFLFVDRITEIELGKRAVGIKNVTMNDYFFKGHFPGKPVMPGVIILEAMAQVGGVMMLAVPENRGKLAFFMTMNNVKFRKTVVPGDQLVFEVIVGKVKSRTGQVFGKARVDGKVVAEAELMFAIVEP
ncbi:MAG: UDP-3-O-acyl-N-acetylglucosamine deacetylase [Candidatus Omnitrophica bacterium]|jgi:UDP-3-O-[3-hydroxymyristoyl] N-acetylglucosamine deacetylase/3-hydroxyacyl-[acyl-carrier-protein] dehydratase|nr:UDP-3-O-acyl-N-acetylglucosamine deacetylase [Candidatus Omnitrophota bacterium]